MNNGLTDKVFLITGATSGMGKATALRFAREGASVVAIGRRSDGLAQWKDYKNVFTMRCDVTRLEDISTVMQTIRNKFQRLDGVCNIAGINDLCYPLLETDDERWDRVMDTDLRKCIHKRATVIK